MKFKIKCSIIIMLSILSITLCNVKVEAIDDVVLTNDAKSAILLEPSTMEIIYEKNSTEPLMPASMTKIMTMLLVMEALHNNIITYDQKLVTSEYATKMGGTQIYLETNEEMSVRDLLKAVAVASANDATIVFAEAIGGSVENFVRMMNEKAKELNLENTKFQNPHGLPADDHYSCAKDMALMSAHLINNYPEILDFTSIYEDYVREDTEKKFWLVNRNKLVKYVDGVDGLKTGWTNEAGYCLTATIKKDSVRLIAVVMGCSTPDKRTNECLQMLNYGVSNYTIAKIVSQGEVLSSIEDIKTNPSKYNLVASIDVNILLKKKSILGEVKKEVDSNKKIAKIYVDNKLVSEIDLIVEEDVKKASIFLIIFEVLKEIFLVSK